MASVSGRLLKRFATRVDELTGGRIGDVDLAQTLYYKALSTSGYYDDSNRQFDLKKHSFDGYDLLLDVEKFHQRQVAEGSIEHELKWFIELIEAGDLVFDIGANIGAFTIAAGTKVPDCTVISLEPEPVTYSQLSANVELNDLDDRVMCRQIAVSGEIGRDTLHVAGVRNQGAHSLARTFHHGDETVDVQTTTVDALSEEYGTPDVIKIDVEGAEAAVLRGMEETIRQGVKLQIDVHEYEMDAMGEDATPLVKRLFNHGEMHEIDQTGRGLVVNPDDVEAPTTLLVSTERSSVSDG